MKRVTQLDGIRGLAIGAVLVHHFIPIVGIGNSKNLIVVALYRVLHLGWLGVDVFFVLSGFLITGVILKDRHRSDFWSNFYLKRAFRILPAFIVVFTITLIAAHIFLPEVHVDASYLIPAIFFLANWTVLHNNEMPLLGHVWSLAVEEQFYFLWPQAAKNLKLESLFKVALALILLSDMTRLTLILLHVNPYIVYKVTPARVDGLSIGAALAIGMGLPAVHGFLTRWWRTIGIASVIALLAGFGAMKGSMFLFNSWSQMWAIPPTIVLTAMLIFASMERALPSVLAAFFGSSVMTYLGKRSYGLYLIHEPICVAIQRSRVNGYLSAARPAIGTNVLLILAGLVVSFLLTEASWYLIESPAQHLKERILRRRNPGPKVTVQV